MHNPLHIDRFPRLDVILKKLVIDTECKQVKSRP